MLVQVSLMTPEEVNSDVQRWLQKLMRRIPGRGSDRPLYAGFGLLGEEIICGPSTLRLTARSQH
jgi:hypothetical protein